MNKHKIIGVFSVLTLLISWQLLAHFFLAETHIFPPIEKIIFCLFNEHSFILTHSKATFLVILESFGIALGISIFLSFCMFHNSYVRSISESIYVLFQCFPMFLLSPLLIACLGWSHLAVVIPVVLMLIFPLAICLHKGISSLPQGYIDLFSLHNATKSQVFWKLQLPYAVPHIISGLKMSASMCGICAIAGEMAGAQSGLGILIQEAKRNFEIELIYAGLLCVFIVTFFFYCCVGLFENFCIKRRYGSFS